MLFESLDKLKRNSILSAILLTTLGAIILILPERLVPMLILVLGYVLVVLALVMMLGFLSSKKSLMDYIKFVAALAIFIVSICVLVYRSDIVPVLEWLFGLLLILDGARTLIHSFTYARRSQRKGWWVLTILSLLLILAGAILLVNPWWDTPSKLTKVIGCAVLFSAIISGLRLFWTWPLRNSKGGNVDGEK